MLHNCTLQNDTLQNVTLKTVQHYKTVRDKTILLQYGAIQNGPRTLWDDT